MNDEQRNQNTVCLYREVEVTYIYSSGCFDDLNHNQCFVERTISPLLLFFCSADFDPR